MMELERACTQGHPSYITKSLEAQEGWLMYGLVRAMRPATVVEIGRLEGVSTQWIGSALRDAGKGHVHSLDIMTKREATARLAPLVEQGIVTVHEFSSHDEEAEALAARIGKVDFLFVDGDHTTESVMADVATWFPTDPDTVVFHDVGQERVRAGIEAAVHFPDWDKTEFCVKRQDVGDSVVMLLQRRRG
jgi:predicted O-methyltransferase YrrM